MRKTKIIATLGPSTSSPEMIRQLIDDGMNIARLNMSHARHDWLREIVNELRAAAKERNVPVGILLDTQGPAIRTGDLPTDLELKPGQKFTLTVKGEQSEEEHSVDVNYENFINDISVGDVVLVDNGTIRMKVLQKFANKIECEVLTESKLKSRRHINLPGVKVSLPALTEKDLEDIEIGLELGVDLVALSFVREAKDLQQLKAVMRRKKAAPLVIAKVEDQAAVRNLNEIINEADGIMIARGDLGIECPYEELPIIQRRIVKACLTSGCPVIVATHLLESMIENPMPTRAEVTDVANAVYEQADSLMLSGETTVGNYPSECLEVLDRVAVRTERSGGAGFEQNAEYTGSRQKLAKGAVVLANELKAQAILVFTLSGALARYTAWMRPRYSPIYALCETTSQANALTLHWGIRPIVIPLDAQTPEHNIELAFKTLKEKDLLHRGNIAVVLGSIATGSQMVDAIQMRTIP